MMHRGGSMVSQARATSGVLAESGDSALVVRARAGDKRAFEALIQPRLRPLLRLTMSILANDADASDAVQDACLRAWRDLPRLREPDRFEAWLWQIAINGCRSALRSRRRAAIREIPVETMPEGFDPPGRDRPLVESLSEDDLIARAFRSLDPDRRTILVLHHVESRSIVEIAALLAIPEGTAKWRLHAARRALERALEVERR
jgi:RNA polymerase sigma-70 factor, ECF subfamily